MSNVTEIRTLGRGDYCITELLNWGSQLQAWTRHDLDEVLELERYPFFLRPMFGACHVGDLIEVFQVGDLERPEKDPLTMATLCVTSFSQQRDGLHMHTSQVAPILRFGSGEKEGISVATWAGRPCVWQDGRRVAVCGTKIEAQEHADKLRKAAGAAPLPKEPKKALRPARVRAGGNPAKCKPEDIGRLGDRRISNVIVARVLAPIAEVLADDQYFNLVQARFAPACRLNLTRFANDTFSEVVEVVRDIVVDVHENRVKLYPTHPATLTGREAESGWVLDTAADGRSVVRLDGRLVSTFRNATEAGWWLSERAIEAKTLATAKTAA